MFCINLCYHEPKECLTFFFRIFILFKLVALHKSNNGSIDLCIWGYESMHKCIGLKVIFNFLITRNWTLVYLICLNLEFAKKSFKLNYVSQKIWVCLYSTSLWPVEHESSRILKEQVLYPHILIYKDALLFFL